MPDANLSDELKAMAQIEAALENLEKDVRARVMRWATDRYEIAGGGNKSGSKGRALSKDHEAEDGEYGNLSEFFNACAPSADADRVLVAAYWFQYKEGQDEAESQRINKELKNLGHGVGNITRAFNILKGQKPALVVQTRKEGTTKQARKKYKVTAAGKKQVEEMLEGKEE